MGAAVGVAAAVGSLLAPARNTLVTKKEYPAERDVEFEEPRIGVFVCNCGTNIGAVVAVPEVAAFEAAMKEEMARHLHGEMSLDKAAGLIKRNTKRYAKRQYTWFRKEEGIHWVDITGMRDYHMIFDHVRKLLHTLPSS